MMMMHACYRIPVRFLYDSYMMMMTMMIMMIMMTMVMMMMMLMVMTVLVWLFQYRLFPCVVQNNFLFSVFVASCCFLFLLCLLLLFRAFVALE